MNRAEQIAKSVNVVHLPRAPRVARTGGVYIYDIGRNSQKMFSSIEAVVSNTLFTKRFISAVLKRDNGYVWYGRYRFAPVKGFSGWSQTMRPGYLEDLGFRNLLLIKSVYSDTVYWFSQDSQVSRLLGKKEGYVTHYLYHVDGKTQLTKKLFQIKEHNASKWDHYEDSIIGLDSVRQSEYIISISPNGRYVAAYESIAETARNHGVDIRTPIKWVKTNKPNSKGYQFWRYSDFIKLFPERKQEIHDYIKQRHINILCKYNEKYLNEHTLVYDG